MAKHNPPGGNICALCTVRSVAPSLKQTASGFIFSTQKKVVFFCACSPQVGAGGQAVAPPTRKTRSKCKCLLAFIMVVVLIGAGAALAWYFLGQQFFFSLYQLIDQLGFSFDVTTVADSGVKK